MVTPTEPKPVVTPTEPKPATPTKLKVEITSDPPGAHVIIGAEEKGKTPVTIEVDKAGTQLEMNVSLAGYVSVNP